MCKFTKLSLALAISLIVSGQVFAAKIGVGAFWGKNIPIVQQDASVDKLWGMKLILVPLSFVAIEPNFTYSGMGQASINLGGISQIRDGGQIKSWGIDLLLGNFNSKFFHFFILGGIAASSIQKENLPDLNSTGYTGGLGFELTPVKSVGIEAMAKAALIPLQEGGAKDNLGISGGINFYFGL